MSNTNPKNKTGVEVRCYNSNDKWITNRSISVNQLIPIPLFNTLAEVRCYNSNNKWITNRSIPVNKLIPTPLFNTGAKVRC